MKAQYIIKELNDLGDKNIANFLEGYFKTHQGGYGEGDKFIGVRIPAIRKLAAKYDKLDLSEINILLDSPVHEHRMAALNILINKFKKSNHQMQSKIYQFYLLRTNRINNWDLVDVSCRDIVGGYLLQKDKEPLYKLAKSKNIWERRIAIVSTWRFIKEGKFIDTIMISKILMNDEHHLIQKAVGWMLREIGKKEPYVLIDYLDKNYKKLPRITLRYAIERLSPDTRDYYLGKRLNEYNKKI